ncbi:MAG: carboxyl-terminal processing protease [Clostridiales bacterium]|nr:carboxyl-terminal processing protease [Clostridiales bacterium]
MIALLTVFVLLFSVTTFAQEAQQEDPNFIFLQHVKEYIMQKYKGDVTETEVLEGALRNIIENNPELRDQAIEGMFETLDQYSTFFYQDEYEQFSAAVDGQFGGIGISVANRNGNITILAPIENTPGDRAGLKSGDKIIYINDVDVSNYDVNIAVPLMRGEPGTSVKLGIKREGYEDILYFNIVRDLIKINPITHNVLENNIGYIRISDFNANTVEYFTDVLNEFDKAKIKKIIIDVRNNPGGSLTQVVDIANYFVPNEGPIVHIEYKDEKQKYTFYSDLKKSKYEVVVLINEGSASASEIFAGAIQDSKAGKIVGTKSFGKGTVQELLPLRGGGAIKMTIARYLTPNGTVIDGDGIHPDVEVRNITQKIDMSKLEKLEPVRKLTLSDKGKDVFAAEQRLALLGYDVGEPDEVFDEKTFKAVKDFQAEQNLYPYGVLDFSTQAALNVAVSQLEVVVDKQLEKAVEILSR